MKHHILPTKHHSMAAAKHVSMMRQDLLFRGFMIETEKGAVCKQTAANDDKHDDKR